MLGSEARGLHNGFVHAPGGHDSAAARGCNGCGITLYAPNLNLVREGGGDITLFCASPHSLLYGESP
jgi:hypothetical protein